ncbi:hypothetical protein psal_cds_1049 [Pandoravirus salinus]|uniref:Uncharacterized protein n=1 Tax=Pandoravirus salinus TaxID=1349410 RepID=S4VY01_9VIRU|nr:hypothetical protein psal_cds_1049 [Pandoravirus salinus]AGO85248.1 hypothetical protein psal_cds_1049 [Pandoravirus salinus]
MGETPDDWGAVATAAIKARAVNVIAWLCESVFSPDERDAIDRAFQREALAVLALVHHIAHIDRADVVVFLLDTCAPGMPRRPEVIDAVGRCVETRREGVLRALHRKAFT